MKQILLILAVIALPGLAYGGGCEVVNISLFEHTDISGHVIPGTDIVSGSSTSIPCATVTVRNTSSGSRLGGKITANFFDGSSKTKSFQSARVERGQSHSTNICWSRRSALENISCDF